MIKYRIQLIHSHEGWAASCLDLQGCHTQGDTREEAIENIQEAIQLWLEEEKSKDASYSVENLELVI